MLKKYVVRLSDEERKHLRQVVGKLKGTSQKVKRAQILLTADADGPGWTDARIAEAFDCRIRTVENIRRRLVEHDFQVVLDGRQPDQPPVAPKLDGEQEARLIALRLGPPPKGFARWSLRLVAHQAVELGLVGSISHETVRERLKKTA